MEDNETIQLQDNNDVQFYNTINLDNEFQKNLEHNFFFLKSPILIFILGPKMSKAGPASTNHLNNILTLD